jgi:hypothetical protein
MSTNDVNGAILVSLAGAVIAALGYVATQTVGWWSEWNSARRQRLARLVQLRSLLTAGRVAYKTQNDLAKKFSKLVEARGLGPFNSYDQTLVEAHKAGLQPQEADLHLLVRGITMNAMRDVNTSLLSWVENETYFRVPRTDDTVWTELAGELDDLHVHLLLWLSKYEIWIPDDKSRALVYLDDEERHGRPFPRTIDARVGQLIDKANKSRFLYGGAGLDTTAAQSTHGR